MNYNTQNLDLAHERRSRFELAHERLNEFGRKIYGMGPFSPLEMQFRKLYPNAQDFFNSGLKYINNKLGTYFDNRSQQNIKSSELLYDLGRNNYPKNPMDTLDRAEQTQLTPLDEIQGGVRNWLQKKANDAPHVNVREIVQLERQVNAIRHAQLAEQLQHGTEDAYAKMEIYRNKRKLNAYKPQPYMEDIPAGDLAASPFDSVFGGEVGNSIQGRVGSAGKPSNQPYKETAFQDFDVVTGRGQYGSFPESIHPNPALPITDISDRDGFNQDTTLNNQSFFFM